MIVDQLKGCGVATITPFKNGGVDLDALSRVLEFQIEGGVDYLVCLGTTAETATLTEEEQKKIINRTLEINRGRKPVVLGNFGGNNTQALLDKFDRFDFEGITALLSVSPYYNKPTQEGIFQHYMALAQRSPLPIIMYNVPGRTASNISAETVVRLAKSHANIAGVKDASADMVQATRIMRFAASGFLALSGDDPSTLPFLACGGKGVISVIANAYPDKFSTMCRLALDGDFEKARKINHALINLHHWLYLEGNPVGIKGCMQLMGLCESEVRLPLTPITSETLKGLEMEMKKVSEFNLL